MISQLLRYNDLVEAGIVCNRSTLYRWIKHHGFPQGILLGPNARAWPEDQVEKWLQARPSNT